MENVRFKANTEYVAKKGTNFKGLKELSIENDIIYVTMGDGTTFSSPINELKVVYTTGLFVSSFLRSYKLTNAKGESIKIGKVNGFQAFEKERTEIYDTLNGMPNIKRSLLEKIEIALLIVVVIIGFIIANS